MRISEFCVTRFWHTNKIISPNLNVIARVIQLVILESPAIVEDDLDNWSEAGVVPNVSRFRIAHVNSVAD